VADRPRIAHVGIAVPAIEPALAFYRDVLGLEPHPPEEADGAAIVSLPFGESEVELLAPLADDTPIGTRHKRGPGIHHICYRVPDLARRRGLPRTRLPSSTSARERAPGAGASPSASGGGRHPPRTDRIR
jgi:methylmalonyl-CoA epimerase